MRIECVILKTPLMHTEKIISAFDRLASQEWVEIRDFFSAEFCQALARECHLLYEQGSFEKAGIGHKQSRQISSTIRGDFTHWLEKPTHSAEPSLQGLFLEQLDILRTALNQSFFLGLQDQEAHYAVYPPGTGYEKHVDNHHGLGARKVTFILYLNESWQITDGGELLLFSPLEENKVIHRIEPQFGTLVLFMSEVFPHQVQESHQLRKSLTGWLRSVAL